ncbi:hypothetical protein AKJ16_DCAP16729 [Drosera capensis]
MYALALVNNWFDLYCDADVARSEGYTIGGGFGEFSDGDGRRARVRFYSIAARFHRQLVIALFCYTATRRIRYLDDVTGETSMEGHISKNHELEIRCS